MTTEKSPSAVRKGKTELYQEKVNKSLTFMFLSDETDENFVTIVKSLLEYFRFFRFGATFSMFHLKRVLERCEGYDVPNCEFSRQFLANILRMTVRFTLLDNINFFSNEETTTKFRPFIGIAHTFLSLFVLHDLPTLMVRYNIKGDPTYYPFSLEAAAKFAYHAFTASIFKFQFDADPKQEYPLGAAAFAAKFQGLHLLNEASKFLYFDDMCYTKLWEHINTASEVQRLESYAKKFEKQIDKHNFSREQVYKEIAKTHQVELLERNPEKSRRGKECPQNSQDTIRFFHDAALVVFVSCSRQNGDFYRHLKEEGRTPSYHDVLQETKRMFTARHVSTDADEETRARLTAYWCFFRSYLLSILFGTVPRHSEQLATMSQIIKTFHTHSKPESNDTRSIVQFLLPRVQALNEASYEGRKFLYVLLSRRPGTRDTIFIDNAASKVVLSPSDSTIVMSHWNKWRRNIHGNFSPEPFLSPKKLKSFLALQKKEAGKTAADPVNAEGKESDVENWDCMDDDDDEVKGRDISFVGEEDEEEEEEKGKDSVHADRPEYVAPLSPSPKRDNDRESSLADSDNVEIPASWLAWMPEVTKTIYGNAQTTLFAPSRDVFPRTPEEQIRDRWQQEELLSRQTGKFDFGLPGNITFDRLKAMPLTDENRTQHAPSGTPTYSQQNNNNSVAAAAVELPGKMECRVLDVFSLLGNGRPRTYSEDEYKELQKKRLAEATKTQDTDISPPPMKFSLSTSSQVSETTTTTCTTTMTTTTVVEIDAVSSPMTPRGPPPAYSPPPQPSPEKKVPVSAPPQPTHSFPVSPSEMPASLRKPLQIKEFVPKAQQQQKQSTPPSPPPMMQALPAALAEQSPTQPLFRPPRPTGFRDPHAVISYAESLMKDAVPLRQEYADDDGYQGPQQQQPSFHPPMPQHAYPLPRPSVLVPLPPPLPVQHHGDPSAGQRALYDPHLDEHPVQPFRYPHTNPRQQQFRGPHRHHSQPRPQQQPQPPRQPQGFKQTSELWAGQQNVRPNGFPFNGVHHHMDPNAGHGYAYPMPGYCPYC